MCALGLLTSPEAQEWSWSAANINNLNVGQSSIIGAVTSMYKVLGNIFENSDVKDNLQR